ncbi:hypothetical protein GW758_02375 [Candidatus Falkowbacteria bacterium]|nr:hypothetical protein [Candidatus Falkowbacteria bacterium]
MNKIDLFPQFSPGEQLDKELGEQLNEAMLEELSNIKNLPIIEGQSVVDKIFSNQRREKKLAEQEDDGNGLKVRYFRKMSLEAFIKMAKVGYQDAASYAEEEPPIIDQRELKYFIIDSFSLDKQEKIETKGLSLKDLVNEHFGVDVYERLAESDFSYACVMDFINNYLDEKYLKQTHTGSVMQKLSPFLSMSVGGVISTLSSDKYPYRKIYCEIVKDDIIPHQSGVNGEKEVFIKKLEMGDIAGVYVDDNKIFELIRNDNTFSQGNYYREHQNEMQYSDDIIQKWRWEVNTNDCLPKRLKI